MTERELPSGVWLAEDEEQIAATLAALPTVEVAGTWANLSHVATDGGEECCVGHMDESEGGCRRCCHCHEWVRPHRLGEPCPARNRP